MTKKELAKAFALDLAALCTRYGLVIEPGPDFLTVLRQSGAFIAELDMINKPEFVQVNVVRVGEE